ncbi:NAD-dependent epimerase [Sulfitobacter alexandrii]|uniref:UDP-glucose 4-epimerase n=1 Tax=Sulfitobacter alexandrii TaxID=1917485 RepID=A0A1J0WL97_9RHOB|nr:NAD-dependent epimerase/dehydratase family protein [Sulfitobacter alexandrii]APE45116.1 NAD-dependent epimerase [Sulfitobacter alexandrii]
MKVLLIGGCGFIGSHVADCLVEHGIAVRIFDRRLEPFRDPLPRVEYVMGDLTDTAQVFEAMSGVDAVIHLASTTVPSTSNLDPVADIKGNLISAVRLLEMMRATDIRKIVYLSSGGTVYGIPTTDPVAEAHPLNPISSYGIVKVAIENYMQMENHLHGLQPIVLRASNPYGPRQGHGGIQGIIGTHLWRTARGEGVEIWGDGSIVRDFIYVRDLADLCVAALTTDTSGCYNAGSGAGASINDIVDRIRAVTADEPGINFDPVYKPGRSFDVPRVVLDISKARRDFRWAPKVDLKEGIERTWEWVKQTSRAD